MAWLPLRRARRRGRRALACCVLPWVLALAPAYVPEWFQKGRPRQYMNSVAETELLMQLAALLMPEAAPINEMFRNFPAPEGWGGHYLEPDLSLPGVLIDENAALFVEYDGYWRHGEKEGMARDQLKNQALLTYAPAGSCVIRISHTDRKQFENNVLWVKVDTWRQGNTKSLSQILMDVLDQIKCSGLEEFLHPRVADRIGNQTEMGKITLSLKAQNLASSADMVGAGANTSEEIAKFLVAQGFDIEEPALVNLNAFFWGKSIDRTLQPIFEYLSDLGLKQNQTLKAVATSPQTLGYSIEQNLKPTVQYLLDLGLTKDQVAKAVATFPPILGCSIEQNLKPTVQYLLDLGLTKDPVAKAVATFPQILGCSIEQNLKPTFAWLLAFGLSKDGIQKLVLGWPRLLGYSISKSFKPKAALLEEFCSPKGARDIIAKNPEIFRFSYKRLAMRLRVLSQQKTSKVYSGLCLTDEAFARRFLS